MVLAFLSRVSDVILFRSDHLFLQVHRICQALIKSPVAVSDLFLNDNLLSLYIFFFFSFSFVGDCSMNNVQLMLLNITQNKA